MSRELTGIERHFAVDEVIVTKTDLVGKITYANDVFLRLSVLTERQALGAPHSIIRHPHMPRSVFHLLWETIKAGGEIFAYVLNRATNGDHYWVFAHVTPSFAADGTITGYHSNRRVPDAGIVARSIQPLYTRLLEIENSQGSATAACAAGRGMLGDLLRQEGTDYERFIFSLDR